MTAKQLQIVHFAARSLGLNDGQYRTVLRNVAGVESAKDLDNEGLELVMAFLEESGFRDKRGPDYWRTKAGRHGKLANERVVRKIETMCQELNLDAAGFCRRMTAPRGDDDRTGDPDQLTPREAYNVIEGLKAIAKREKEVPTQGCEDATFHSDLRRGIDGH